MMTASDVSCGVQSWLRATWFLASAVLGFAACSGEPEAPPEDTAVLPTAPAEDAQSLEQAESAGGLSFVECVAAMNAAQNYSPSPVGLGDEGATTQDFCKAATWGNGVPR